MNKLAIVALCLLLGACHGGAVRGMSNAGAVSSGWQGNAFQQPARPHNTTCVTNYNIVHCYPW